MSSMMIDDYDDNEIEIPKEDPDTVYIKNIIKNGLSDLEKITDILEDLLPLAAPFGDEETIMELILFYSDVIPRLLLGDYDSLLEGLNETEQEMAQIVFKRNRKEIFSKLVEKYN